MRKILIVILLLLNINSFGFIVKGKIVDSKSKGAIEYVCIGIKGKAGGTFSDSVGNFSLVVSNGDVLQISFIGYYKSKIVGVCLMGEELDLEEISLFSAIDNSEPLFKGLFKKKKSFDCEISLKPVSKLKDEDLIVKCKDGTLKYIWKREENNVLSVDFKTVNFCSD